MTKNTSPKYSDGYLELRELFWQEARPDPDNWVTIPEFGVMPEAVNYVGFGDPLVHLGSSDIQVAQDLRMILRAARQRIRMEFSTYMAMKMKAWEFGDPGHRNWQRSGASAAAYMLLENALSIAVLPKSPNLPSKAEHNFDKMRLENIARAGAILGAMVTGDAAAIAKMVAVGEGASRGGKRGAITKRQNAISPEAVVQAAKNNGWPENSGVANDLAGRFGCSAAHIRRILRQSGKT